MNMACTPSVEWAWTLENGYLALCENGCSPDQGEGPRGIGPIISVLHEAVLAAFPHLVNTNHDSVTWCRI